MTGFVGTLSRKGNVILNVSMDVRTVVHVVQGQVVKHYHFTKRTHTEGGVPMVGRHDHMGVQLCGEPSLIPALGMYVVYRTHGWAASNATLFCCGV